MTSVNRRVALMATTALALGLRFTGDGHAQGTDAALRELYEAAKKERPVTWYVVPLTEAGAERVANSFAKKYPGVSVNPLRSTASVAFQRVNLELQSEALQCDVLTTSIMEQLEILKKQGALLKFVPSSASSMLALPGVKDADPDGYYHATVVYPVTIIYNTQMIKAADAPQSWVDLLDPKWAGKIIVPHPAFSGTFGIVTVQLQKMYGWDYFVKLEENNPQVVRSLVDVVSSVSSGERLVGIGPGAIALESASRSNPVGLVYPKDGVIPAVSGSGILAGTDNPNASKLFMEFLHSSDMSRVAVAEFNEPLHPGIPVAQGARPLLDHKVLLPSNEEVRTQLPEVQERWRQIFGM